MSMGHYVAKKDEKKYSVVVLMENAGSGGKVAAPIAREIFHSLVKKQTRIANS